MYRPVINIKCTLYKNELLAGLLYCCFILISSLQQVPTSYGARRSAGKKDKDKGKRRPTCIAPLMNFTSRRSGMDRTGLPLQTTPYLPLPCERSPDGAIADI